MPKYQVTDPKTGRTIELDGDGPPPTEAELEQVFSSLGPPGSRSVMDTVSDVGIGALKGAANTISGLGQMARKIPGVSQLDRIMTPISVNTTPSNAAQKIGFGVEQVGEFFVPVAGVAGKAKLAADVAKSGLLTMAQGGSPAAGAVSAGITAAIPAVGPIASKASGALKSSAEKSMAQALGATKEWAKSEASKIAPQMLRRGVRGSRAAMLEQAKAAARAGSQQLDDAYKAAAASGDTVSGLAARGHIQIARDALKVADASGVRRVVPGTERAVQQLDNLDEFLASMGDDIPVDKAAAIKRTWDRIVSKSGLFGPKSVSTASDNADAWALREASGSLREMLNSNPTIAALNAEVGFWTGLKNVLRETEKRTQSQRGGLIDAVRGAGGAVVGSAVGGPIGAGLGQVVTQRLSSVVNSEWFKTTAAGPFKKTLADALASGNAERVSSVLGKITAAMPAQMRQVAPAQ